MANLEVMPHFPESWSGLETNENHTFSLNFDK